MLYTGQNSLLESNCIGSVILLSLVAEGCDHRFGVQESGEEQGLPVQGTCPGCGATQTWGDVLSKSESVPWRQSRYFHYFTILFTYMLCNEQTCPCE